MTTPHQRILNVAALPEQTTDGYIPVHWRIDGAARQGIIHVRVPDRFDDRKVIAELCALNHLMTGARPIYGSSRAPASSLTTVTAGAIRKAHRKQTEKTEIIPFARFLFSSFCEGELKVDKNIAWATLLPISGEWRIEARPTTLEDFPLTAFNAVVSLTRHAVVRYQERSGARSVAHSISALRRLLADQQTIPMARAEYQRCAGLKKYGKAARCFIHSPSKMIFVVLREAEKWILATVYYLSYAKPQSSNLTSLSITR
jgi:hypothetical protein